MLCVSEVYLLLFSLGKGCVCLRRQGGQTQTKKHKHSTTHIHTHTHTPSRSPESWVDKREVERWRGGEERRRGGEEEHLGEEAD